MIWIPYLRILYFLTSTYLLKNQVVWTESYVSAWFSIYPAPQTPVEGLSLPPKMYTICSIPRLAPQTLVEGLSLPPKMYTICSIPRLAPQTLVEGLSLPPKMYTICSIPRLAPQTLVEGLSLPPKMYTICWNFMLGF